MKKLIRRVFPLSIRLQLMFWYTTVFAMLLLFTGAFFYQHLETSLEASLDTTLQIRAQQIASELEVVHGIVTLHDLTINPLGEQPSMQTQWSGRDNVDYGELVRLLDGHGKLLSETPAFQFVSAPQESISQPLQGHPWQGTVVTSSGREIRLYSRAFFSTGHVLALILVGESLTNLHTLLHELVGELLAIGALVLVMCAGGSYWLAARSFAPIQRLAQTARRIQAGDLHQRVPIPPAQDELQYLALTLNEMLDSLEQAFVLQRRFVADASHELRTPIAVLRNKAEVALLSARSPQDYIRVLRAVCAESERLSRLIGDLLDLARGDEGRTHFAREEVALDELGEMVVAHLQPLAQKRHIHLSFQASPPAMVQGDEARLIQVLLNLTENALHYTPAGGRVSLWIQQEQAQVILTVQDTGVGITARHLPHIFERFYRGDHSRQRSDAQSSGLGLAITDWIVRAHGGTIEVESQVGVGSIFRVRLPSNVAHPKTSVRGMDMPAETGWTVSNQPE
jgi:heavy metal sensor kinase